MDDSNGKDTVSEETKGSEETNDQNAAAGVAAQTPSSDADADDDKRIYRVVVNHEEQYSIWFAASEIPKGWRDGGKSGTKTECLDYINEVWTDMRPLSLRKRMAEAQKNGGGTEPKPQTEPREADPRDDLVGFLASGQHPVVASLRPEKTVKRLKEVIDRGYLHVTFTDTRGGTELGFTLDRERSDCVTADFDNGTGSVHAEGELYLDSAKVRCIADIELTSLSGVGHLERLEDDKEEGTVAGGEPAGRAN